MRPRPARPPAARPAPDPLVELARRHGVLAGYLAQDGTAQRSSPEALVAVLGALGVPIDHPDQAGAALRSARADAPRPVLEPVLVSWVDRPRPVVVTVPADLDARGRGWVSLEREDGTVDRRPLAAALGPAVGRAEVDGGTVVRHELKLAAPDRPLAPGYHRLRIEAPGVSADALVVAAARIPAPERGWAVFMPVHSLRTGDDRGVGSYRDLAELRRTAGRFGAATVGVLPLYPTYPDDPSPYLPVSKLAWNELFVAVDDLPELERSPEARRARARWDRAPGAGSPGLVDYPAVRAGLRPVLAALARTLFSGPSPRRDELETFVGRRPDVAAYARFRAAGDALGVPWPEWPDPRPGRLPARGVAEDDVQYHLYAQWVAEHQVAAASRAVAEGSGAGRPGLYLDYPLGVHPGGFDTWWSPGSFVAGIHVGAPPDDFFSGGQDWTFPPVHPVAERRTEYRYTRAALGHALRHAAVLRVDHVMGLHRLYWIPEGFDATNGAYVRYRGDELSAIVAVEAGRVGASVVGEDLGTVPDEVRRHMADDGMLRSWVFQFEASAADPLPRPPEASMASFGTHDLPRFAAFWAGDDIDDHEAGGQSAAEADAGRAARAGLRTALLAALAAAPFAGAPIAAPPVGRPRVPATTEGDEVRRALAGCLASLAASPARLVLVDLEDLWLERQPHNRPGTPAGANWRHRARRTLAQLAEDPFAREVLGEVDRLRRAVPPRPARRAPAATGRTA